MTSALHAADHARGARVEIAVRAAQEGDIATAAGILAGMSAEERDAFGPLVTAALNNPSPPRGHAGTDRFGNHVLRRITQEHAEALDVPEWVNAR